MKTLNPLNAVALATVGMLAVTTKPADPKRGRYVKSAADLEQEAQERAAWEQAHKERLIREREAQAAIFLKAADRRARRNVNRLLNRGK